MNTPTAAQLIESERRAERRFLETPEPHSALAPLDYAQITRDIRAIDDDVAEWKRSQDHSAEATNEGKA